MSCSRCGQSQPHQNPLDCSQRLMSCHNPCAHGPENTPQCESLPSQIQNFTTQFFGVVVKTEVNGQVVWSLPCGLDVGLPNNPRSVDEGLACYFLRLFSDGIIGLTGPQGIPGTSGTNGSNAFTIVLKGFTQPSIAAPVVQVVTQFNPGIYPGIFVNIQGSGWYLVNETDGNGVLLLTLTRAADNASSNIPAGRLVVPSGYPGASIQGPQGVQGPKGDKGDTGGTVSNTNGIYFASIGTDFPLPVTYSQATFVNSAPLLTLPDTGIYIITATVGVIGNSGIVPGDSASVKLFNTSVAADIDGSVQEISNMIDGELSQVVINTRVQTDTPNQTVAVFGKCSTANKVSLRALHTSLTYVRVS